MKLEMKIKMEMKINNNNNINENNDSNESKIKRQLLNIRIVNHLMKRLKLQHIIIIIIMITIILMTRIMIIIRNIIDSNDNTNDDCNNNGHKTSDDICTLPTYLHDDTSDSYQQSGRIDTRSAEERRGNKKRD